MNDSVPIEAIGLAWGCWHCIRHRSGCKPCDGPGARRIALFDTLQLHWRAGRAVTDWPSLRAEVRKWQGEARLAWGEEDILDVARYLNDSIYHFAKPGATALKIPPTAGVPQGSDPNGLFVRVTGDAF